MHSIGTDRGPWIEHRSSDHIARFNKQKNRHRYSRKGFPESPIHKIYAGHSKPFGIRIARPRMREFKSPDNDPEIRRRDSWRRRRGASVRDRGRKTRAARRRSGTLGMRRQENIDFRGRALQLHEFILPAGKFSLRQPAFCQIRACSLHARRLHCLD